MEQGRDKEMWEKKRRRGSWVWRVGREDGGLMGLERWEGSGKVKLTFLRRDRRCWGRGSVNELVCMAGTSQWPRARSWHATDTRQKLTLTPQIITFSLWKLALPSHSSHSVSVSLLSPALFLFLTSPPLARVYWRKNGVDSEKQLPVIYLSPSSSDNEFQVKGEIMIFSRIKSNLWAGTATVTICGMPYGIKGLFVTHVPTYSAHTDTHTYSEKSFFEHLHKDAWRIPQLEPRPWQQVIFVLPVWSQSIWQQNSSGSRCIVAVINILPMLC